MSQPPAIAAVWHRRRLPDHRRGGWLGGPRWKRFQWCWASWPGIRRRRLRWADVHWRFWTARRPRGQTCRPIRSLPAGLTAGEPAPACRGFTLRAARLPEDVVVEEEAADLAAARACRGSPTSIVSESRMQGRLKNKLKNDGNSQGARLLCVGQSHDIVSSERALDEQRDPC